MADRDFQLNLADPEEVAAKMPEIRDLYAEKQRELKALREAFVALSRQVEFLGRLVGAKQPARGRAPVTAARRARLNARARNAPGQDRAVAALERADRPMGPTSLYNFMVESGMDAPKDANTLGANLWAAWKSERIMKAPNGVYTPLDGTGRTEWDRPLTDYDWTAQNVPNAPQPPASNPDEGVVLDAPSHAPQPEVRSGTFQSASDYDGETGGGIIRIG
jgi:hypothetical protein